ncbi:hypothetical protein BDZ94DRAFT_1278711, partial [Collybia nuda]
FLSLSLSFANSVFCGCFFFRLGLFGLLLTSSSHTITATPSQTATLHITSTATEYV